MPSNSVLCASGKFFTYNANTTVFHAVRDAAVKGADHTQVLDSGRRSEGDWTRQSGLGGTDRAEK